MESRWWGLEEAMDLLSTSRRLTLRSSRVSAVVSRWPLDIDSGSSPRLLHSRFRQPFRPAKPEPVFATQPKPEKKPEIKEFNIKPGPQEFSKQLAGEAGDRALQAAAECEELRNKLRAIQDENLKLQAVISDLTQVNKRWQNYNNDRQIYVQKLLNTIQDQQEQLNKMGEQRAFANEEAEVETATASSRNLNFEHEISRLQVVERKLKEKIEVLEFQVKANRDDWEAELNEKKQALKEKADIEGKVNQLMSELQSLKQSIMQRQRHAKMNLCECCRLRITDEMMQPVQNKLFRTAVHLPCSSQQWREELPGCSTTNQEFCELDIDGFEKTENNLIRVIKRDSSLDFEDQLKKTEQEDNSECSVNRTDMDSKGNVTNIWNIRQCSEDGKEVGVSYSRASTVPLVSSSPLIQMTPSNSNSSITLASVASLQDEPVTVGFSTKGANTVTSFVQIPIVKSSSAPENKTANTPKSSRLSLDSFNPHKSTAPVTSTSTLEETVGFKRGEFFSSSDIDEGVETLTRQDMICPGCGTVFPPDKHLKFLDHFETCQRDL